MNTWKSSRAKVASVVLAACLALACLALAACGGSSGSSSASASASTSSATSSASSEAASSSATASASASASSSATDPTAKFTGSWKIAAAEQNGVTMGGNFGELLGMNEQKGDLTIDAGGTGSMTTGDEAITFNWTPDGIDAITLTASATTKYTQETIPVTYKDGALFMEMTQNGQTARAIFTHDGTYAAARQITLAGAAPITSEEELLGTWKLVGMNMGGVSMYGEADALQSQLAADASITFKEGGVAEMQAGNGTWAVGPDGATITSQSLGSMVTSPIVKIGDEIAIDYSASFGGAEFIILMAKL